MDNYLWFRTIDLELRLRKSEFDFRGNNKTNITNFIIGQKCHESYWLHAIC
jgi:hypothetical protein